MTKTAAFEDNQNQQFCFPKGEEIGVFHYMCKGHQVSFSGIILEILLVGLTNVIC